MAELLATGIELLSVMASKRQTKKPIEIPRPDFAKARRAQEQAEAQYHKTDDGKPGKPGVVTQAKRDQSYAKAINVLSSSARPRAGR